MVSVIDKVKRVIKFRVMPAVRHVRLRMKSQKQVEREFRERYIADVPVNIGLINEYRSENFPPSGPQPWLDRPDALEQIEKRLSAGKISEADAVQCRKWVNDGYIIIKNSVPGVKLDEMWAAYEKGIECKLIPVQPEPAAPGDKYPGRYLNPHLKIKLLDDLLKHATFDYWNRLLIGVEPIPFQTITAHKGSQQRTHSDTIHMTTYPLGYLTAAWIAFEDIHPDSGPLVYYPGSHKLPYEISHAAGLLPGEWRKNPSAYAEKYEPFVEKIIARENLKPEYFCAEKGDTLIWHANLLHGGSKRHDLSHSRKSVVCHYYFKGVVCYHDLAGVPADADRKGEYDSSMTDMLM